MFQIDPTPTPQPGDLVITAIIHSARAWVVSEYRHEGQIHCATYDEALERAKRFAHDYAVDVFYTEDDGHTYVLLARHRAV